MFNIIGRRSQLFALSGILILVCIVALAVFGLKPGIEFSSGSLLNIRFEQNVDIGELKAELSNIGYSSAIVQSTNSGNFEIRTMNLTDNAKDDLKQSLTNRFGALTEEGFTNIKPTVSLQTVRTVIIAVILAALGSVLYITFAFRRMPQPVRYGICSITAMAFDVFMAIGLFAILARFFNWEINLMFITGLLAVIGYSTNDKIVLFDRIREHVRLTGGDFAALVNRSVVETLTRSLITSVSTLFAVFALMLFVGSSIMNFLVVLLIGIVAGTYSSIMIAAPLLVVWHNGEWYRFLPWLKRPTGS